MDTNEEELTSDSSRLLPLSGMRRAMENRRLIHRVITICPDQEISFDVKSIGISLTADFTDGADRERA